MEVIGAQLAFFRIRAGLTQTGLSERSSASEQTIASIEQGRRVLMPHLADEFDQLLGTGGALAVGVAKLPPRDKYPVWAADFMMHEREAVALLWYENQVLPGLLQTEAYARATFRSDLPPLHEDEIELRVAARLERQEVLGRKEPVLASFIVSEAALKDRLGGPEVMREQIAHLRACTELTGVTIQVMPFGNSIHAGLSGPFVLLETAGHQRLAYSETQLGSQLISDPDKVTVLTAKYGMLRMQALDEQETRGLLDQLLGET
jgi:transcriptional regulator with XRE-family HTH domain